ncbi:heterokaryon incompatibility protein-domain-containing protein, partial [Plectosphaerella plurivora]
MVDGQCRRFGFPIVRRRGPIPYAICQPRLISRRFDSEQARKWLRYCQDHHQGPCLSKPSVVTDLCLIDCRSRTVVEAPADAEYVALSYCWGQPSILSPGWFQWTASVPSVTNQPTTTGKEGHGILQSLPKNVPAVISDAMLVTISMGYSYLWVDRYCIDQNSLTKHTQISQMDTIYQRAELTIIAAAGEDPSYGIPGVGLRHRRQQLTCSAGDLDFWSTMTHPHRALQTSAWFKRAWTFQEGLLSRRRLIFTDDQAYYECASMNCLESMDSDLDSLHTEDKTKFMECLRSGFFGNNNQFTTGGFGEVLQTPTGNLGLLRQMIEIFTDRDMTYDADSLNAFVGVLRRFEKSPTTTRSIWGLPLLCPVGNDGADISKEADASFMSSLAWSHETKLNDAHELVHPRRRDGFPSWSWCGWAGSIQHMQLPPNSLLKSITLEDSSGALLTPSAYLAHVGPTQGPELKPLALWITGIVIPPSAFSITLKKTETGTDREMCIWGFAKAYASLSVGAWDREDVEESLMKGESRQCVCLGDCD